MSELCCPHALLSLGPRVFCGVPSLRPGPFWSCAPRVRFCQRGQKEMFAFWSDGQCVQGQEVGCECVWVRLRSDGCSCQLLLPGMMMRKGLLTSQTNTDTHACTHTRTRVRTRTRAPTHTHAHAHARKHASTDRQTDRHARTHTHARTRTHARTHTHTHTRTRGEEKASLYSCARLKNKRANRKSKQTKILNQTTNFNY